jgi:hypothetical protein
MAKSANPPQVSFRADETFRIRVNAAARYAGQSVGAVLQSAFETWLKAQDAGLRRYVEADPRKHSNLREGVHPRR